jgi:hypothetical protein
MVIAVMTLALSGCISRLDDIRRAQAECSQMGFTGDQMPTCTQNQLQHDDLVTATEYQ